MKLPRRTFLHLAAGAAALPAVSRIAALRIDELRARHEDRRGRRQYLVRHHRSLAAAENWKLWGTLRCDERFLDRDMSEYTKGAGLIDIGRAGCSDTPHNNA
jgi:hypothetical protein